MRDKNNVKINVYLQIYILLVNNEIRQVVGYLADLFVL